MSASQPGWRASIARGSCLLVLVASIGTSQAAPPETVQPAPAPNQAANPQADLAPAPRSIPDDGLSKMPGQKAQVPIPAPCRPPDLNAPPKQGRLLTIDLPGALSQVNATNPTIALARERVNEAYARYQQAAVLWVPNTFIGDNPDAPMFVPMFYHHDGLIQNAAGTTFNTVKSSFALESGVSLNLSLADAIFAPRAARQATAAAAAAARTTTDNIQLEVAYAYLDLLRAFGALAINAEMTTKAEEMLRAAEGAEQFGLGKTTADANRARTEFDNLRRERFDLEGQAAVASARLAQLLVLDPAVDLVPADRVVVPIALVNTDVALDELIATGLLNRPELAESRALVQQALIEWRASKYRPLIPQLQVAYYASSFQGGDPGFHNTSFRDDIVAQAGWQLQNGGLGDLFRTKTTRARYNEANFHVLEVQTQVGAEVTSAAKLTMARGRTLRIAAEAVRQAETMWDKLSAAAFGVAVGGPRQFDALQPLIAEQQLRQARIDYLDEVISYNRNQFRLYWSMGQPPLSAMPCAMPVPIDTPVLPTAAQTAPRPTK
jgi:outer membrane protein TolC